MKISVDVPEVGNCAAKHCAFNRDGNCHAQAITVGNSIDPVCDTFIASGQHNKRQPCAGVGACKVARCRHNDDLLCQADSVRVGMHGQHAKCETFDPR